MRAGCTACCHRKVGCTIPEAIGIAAGLDDCEDDEKQRILAAARLLHERTATLDDAGRTRSGLPCAFLRTENGGVYGGDDFVPRHLFFRSSGLRTALFPLRLRDSDPTL